MAAKITVGDINGLENAFATATNGDIVEIIATLRPYVVTTPLVVPKGVAVIGVHGIAPPHSETDMRGIPWPTGFVPNTNPKLEADPNLAGDMLTLRDGARLKGLTIRDVPNREGNLVTIASTQAEDSISASIQECELVNPNAAGQVSEGPIGRAILVVTRNPAATPPAPHEGARLSVRIERTIVRCPGGGSSIFAVNFAPRARIVLNLAYNLMGGGLDAVGGVSRPVPVVGAETLIRSFGNIYRSDNATPGAGIGWALRGGSNPPSPSLTPPSTDGNTLSMFSTQDEIAGFAVGILAVGGARPLGTGGPVNLNRASLHLETLSVTSTSSDFVLFGAQAGAGVGSPGDDNRLLITIEGECRGSLKTSAYQDSATINGTASASPGNGNRLAISAGMIIGLTPPPDPAFLI